MATITLSTRTAGSLGTVKVDKASINETNTESNSITAAQYNTAADDIIELQSYHNDQETRLGSVESSAALNLNPGQVLGRSSTGAAAGKPCSDTSFNLLGLTGTNDWVDALGFPRATSGIITANTNIDVGAANGVLVDVDGSTPITTLGITGVGVIRIIRFISAGQINHSSTLLVLPTGANITTASGDQAMFVSLGTNSWRCLFYTRANGTALAGSGGGGPNPSAGAAGDVQLSDGAGDFVAGAISYLISALVLGPKATGHHASTLSVNGFGVNGFAPAKPHELIGPASPASVADVMILLEQIIELLQSNGLIKGQYRT